MTGEELMCCSCADIAYCSAENLVDLKRVEIAADQPAPIRMEQYLEQIRNPYLFRVDKLIVKVSFTGTRELSSVLAGLMTGS